MTIQLRLPKRRQADPLALVIAPLSRSARIREPSESVSQLHELARRIRVIAGTVDGAERCRLLDYAAEVEASATQH